MEFTGIADEAGKPIETQIRAHLELGWKFIEVRNTAEGCITDVSDAEFDRVFGLVTDAGLTISCFASQIGNWSRAVAGDFEIDRAELSRAIPRMQRAGTKFIRIMSWRPDETPMDEWKAEALRRVGELVKTAEDGGIMIAHENCTGWASESPANTLEMLETIGSPALGLIYDTANPLQHGKNSMEFATGLKDHVDYLHIKDWKLVDGGHGHGVWPGEGDSEVREQLALVFGTGYDGFVSIEPHIAAIIHEAKEADDADAAYDGYVEYGRRMMALVGEVKASL